MSNITILGAYGVKSAKGGSSAFFINPKHMIDAGNLISPLKDNSADIETIWITHSHLDHIADIAYILDNYYETRTQSLKLCGLKETLDTIKKHFLNDKIWPDFSKIPLYHGRGMSIVYEEIVLGENYSIGDDESIQAFATDHTVPSCGYIITKKQNAVLISADTYALDSVLEEVEKNGQINTLVIECSFPSVMEVLAKTSKHLTAELLFARLKSLESKNLKLYVNHLKPSFEKEISAEIEAIKGEWDVTILKDGDKIYF